MNTRTSEDGSRKLNGLVFGLVLLAVILAVIAAWMRYSQRRRAGSPPSESGDAIEWRLETRRPGMEVRTGLMNVGGPAWCPAPDRPVNCPQARGTWTPAAMVGPSPARPASRARAGGLAGTRTARRRHVEQLGVEVLPAGAPGGSLSGPGRYGASVTGVPKGSRAWNAGVRAGDVIIEFNENRVPSVEELRLLASRATPGTDARIKILRNGRTRDVSIMVGGSEATRLAP